MSQDSELSDYVRQTRDHYRDPDVASRYQAGLTDSIPDRVLSRLEIRAVQRALDTLPGRPWAAVADIPAGTGKLTGLLTRLSRAYFALDISPAMLAYVRDRPRVVANAEHLPIRPGHTDVIVCLRLLHRVPADVFSRIVAEAMATALRGCVISYAGPPRSPRLHAVLRRLMRRAPYPRHGWTPAGVAAEVGNNGGRVVSDRSVSFGLTSERVAAIVIDR